MSEPVRVITEGVRSIPTLVGLADLAHYRAAVEAAAA